MSMDRIATVETDQGQLYGAVTKDGFVALSHEFPQWPTLRHVIAAGVLDQVPCPTRKRSSASA